MVWGDATSSNSQDYDVFESYVRHAPVHIVDHSRVVDVRPHFQQAEDSESPVIAPILEVVAVLPYQGHADICNIK